MSAIAAPLRWPGMETTRTHHWTPRSPFAPGVSPGRTLLSQPERKLSAEPRSPWLVDPEDMAEISTATTPILVENSGSDGTIASPHQVQPPLPPPSPEAATSRNAPAAPPLTVALSPTLTLLLSSADLSTKG